MEHIFETSTNLQAMSEDKELEQALALSMASAMPAAEIAASTNGQPNTSLPALSAEQRDASGSQPQSETKITPETQQKVIREIIDIIRLYKLCHAE